MRVGRAAGHPVLIGGPLAQQSGHFQEMGSEFLVADGFVPLGLHETEAAVMLEDEVHFRSLRVAPDKCFGGGGRRRSRAEDLVEHIRLPNSADE